MLTSGRNNLRLVRYLPNGNPHVAWKIKNGLAAMRRNRYQLVWLLDCARTAAIQPGLAAQSMRLFRRRTALRLWCSLARRLALLHLLLLSGMLLLKLLRLLSVALLHWLFLRVVVVFRGGLLVFFFLLLLEFLVILCLLGS